MSIGIVSIIIGLTGLYYTRKSVKTSKANRRQTLLGQDDTAAPPAPNDIENIPMSLIHNDEAGKSTPTPTSVASRTTTLENSQTSQIQNDIAGETVETLN
jgi:hypothetical protein